MSRFRRAAVTAVLLLAGVFTAPGAAWAETLPWTSAPCVTGWLGDVYTEPVGLFYVVHGDAIQCGPTVEHGGFQVVVYDPAEALGWAHGFNARQFPSVEEGVQVTFGAAVNRRAGTYGICLVADTDERVVCGSISVSRTMAKLGIPPFLTPIGTDDPLVAKGFASTPYSGSPNPAIGNGGSGGDPHTFCGTCW